MTDLDVVYIALQGAVDRFVGRPRSQNPYSPESARHGWEAWLLGWDHADWVVDVRGQDEAARWLRETA